jgi:carbon monoxide dehydrogenase subunit G
MKLSGTQNFAAPPKDAYEALLNPEFLRECMPGCESLEPTGPGQFDITFGAPIPAIKGSFTGTVQILDQKPPESFTMRVAATGKSGFVNADARMRIEPDGEASIVRYEADADIGGPAASVGQRVITGISRRQVDSMMRCLEAKAVGRPKEGLWARIKAWFRSKFKRSEKTAAPAR